MLAGKFDTLTDVFLSRLDPSGKLTLIATWAGKGSDQANGIAVDAAGFIYVAGVTTSSDFSLALSSAEPSQQVGEITASWLS